MRAHAWGIRPAPLPTCTTMSTSDVGSQRLVDSEPYVCIWAVGQVATTAASTNRCASCTAGSSLATTLSV